MFWICGHESRLFSPHGRWSPECTPFVFAWHDPTPMTHRWCPRSGSGSLETDRTEVEKLTSGPIAKGFRIRLFVDMCCRWCYPCDANLAPPLIVEFRVVPAVGHTGTGEKTPGADPQNSKDSVNWREGPSLEQGGAPDVLEPVFGHMSECCRDF